REFSAPGKVADQRIKPRLAGHLQEQGFEVDVEDRNLFLKGGMPAWRDKETGGIVPTSGRRRIDLVVRSEGNVVALIETESDLNDLRETGISRRSGHYDVFSIARRSDGNTYFDSYKSLERMASAAFYAGGGTPRALELVTSEAPQDHNPLGLGLFLVCGNTRSKDRRILEPRLEALNARLISLNVRG
ncbi:hypothetical protein, partial [Pseudonocardia halophobica]